MDQGIRGSTAAPLFCQDDAPTSSFAEETPASVRDPPVDRDPPASGGAAPAPAPAPPSGPAPAPAPVAPATAPVPATEPIPAAVPPAPPQAPPGPPRCPRSVLDVPASVALALEAYRPLALSVVLRSGVPTRNAPDVVQNLFLSLLPTWAERTSWPAKRCADYVAACARIVARRYRGRAARRPESLHACLQVFQEQAADEEPLTAEDLLVAHEREAERARETELGFLRDSTAPAFWRVFHDHIVSGVPISAIAQSEGAPVPTMYNRLRLARRDMRAAITRLRATLPPR